MTDKKDIANRKDIERFISVFYTALLEDPNINFFFKHIQSKESLADHLKIITDFWEDILFGTTNYGKNAMKPHFLLHKKITFKEEHFNIWLNHFKINLDKLFEGEKAELAKTRATSIATIMQIKLLD